MFQDQSKSKSKSNTWEIILFSLLMFNIYPFLEIMRISGENQRHLRSKTFSSCKKLNSSKNRLVNKNFVLVFNFFFRKIFFRRISQFNNRELKQRRRQRQRERQKAKQQNTLFRLAKQQLCTRITLLLYIFCRLYTTTTTTTLKCLNPRFLEDSNTRQQFFFSFPEL